MWLSTDPLSGYKPNNETEHYKDGQHNGGIYNSGNLNTYGYTYQNPIRYIDPNGKQVDVIIDSGKYYKADVGHTFVSIGSGESRVVYSYERWAGTHENSSGSHTPLNNGSSVMVRLYGDDAVSEINKYIKEYNAQVYRIEGVNENTMRAELNKEFNKSQKTPTSGKYKGDNRAHVIDEYLLMSNNCTTKVMKALKKSTKEPLFYNFIIYDESGNEISIKRPLGNSISPRETGVELRSANSRVTNVTNKYNKK